MLFLKQRESMKDDRINPDALYSPGQVSELENISVATTYNRMAGGEYGTVFKDGRKTAITGQGILERRRNKLKPAKFKAPSHQPGRFHTIRRKSAQASTA
jgi:hypothetical protein